MSLNCYNFSTSSKRPYLNLCLIILGLTVSLGCSSKEKQKEELNFVGASNLCDHYAAVAPQLSTQHQVPKYIMNMKFYSGANRGSITLDTVYLVMMIILGSFSPHANYLQQSTVKALCWSGWGALIPYQNGPKLPQQRKNCKKINVLKTIT